MEFKAGSRLRSVTSAVEMIVIRCGSEFPTVACGGKSMTESAPDTPIDVPLPGLDAPVLLGKRYVDAEAQLELLCVKPGAGTLTCNGRPMLLKDAKPLPASD